MQARADPDYPIVIFFDGHGSHATVLMIDLARKCGVHLFRLPPHTTHKLQPFDVGVFGPFQRVWRNNCEEFSAVHGRGIARPEFIQEYMKVRRGTFTTEIITSAWRKTGLYPLNPDIFTDLDCSPSQMTSTLTHYPASFPVSLTRTPSNQTHSTSSTSSNLDTSSSSDGSDTDECGSFDRDTQASSQSPPPVTLPPEYEPIYHVTIPKPLQLQPLEDTAPMKKRFVDAATRAEYWEGRASTLQHQLEVNNVHFAFSVRENDRFRTKLYAKDEPKEPRSQGLKSGGRLLTTDDVIAFETERADEKADKERKRVEKKEKKVHEEAERARNRDRLGRDIRFTKPLKRMLRPELNDVLAVMSLPHDQKNARECIRDIEDHVEKYLDLKVDPRFGRIFNTRYATPAPPGPANIPPPLPNIPPPLPDIPPPLPNISPLLPNIPPPLPKMPYRFDTPKPDFREDRPPMEGLQFRPLDTRTPHSPPVPYPHFQAMPYTFPSSSRNHRPLPHSPFPPSYNYTTTPYILPQNGVQPS